MNVDTPALRQEDQFRELLGVLRRRKAIVVSTLILFIMLGIASLFLLPPSYQVLARVALQQYLNGPAPISSNPMSRVTQVGTAPDIGAQMARIQSEEVLRPAFQQANASLPTEDAAKQAIEVEEVNTSPIIDVKINLPDADQATRVAQAIPVAFNDLVSRERTTGVTRVVGDQESKVANAQKELAVAQLALEKELSNQGSLPIAAGAAEGAERTSRLNNFETQLESARVNLSSAEAQLAESVAAQAKIPPTIQDLHIQPSVERLASEKRVIADLEGQLQSLLTTYTERNPEVRALRAKLNKEYAYQKTIETKTDTSTLTRNPERPTYDARVADARTRVEAARVEVTKLEGVVAKERKELENLLARLPKQRQLQSALDSKQAALQGELARLSELQSLKADPGSAMSLVSISPPLKTQPVIARTLIASTLLGVIFGIIGALVRDRFDNRIYTLEQIYDVSGAVPIGQVPSSVKALSGGTGSQNRNRVLESYRSLRFNLESTAASEGAAQSVLISSAQAGEGRAGLSLNLATEAATDARKTILVDGDLRTPELHELLKMSRGPGLSDVLSGTASLDSVLKTTPQENLLFLPAGTEHGNPLELLVGPAFADLHEALKERADVIILNSPSLMRYTDARAMANVVDSVLFVAKRGFTRRDAMRYCFGMLRRAKGRILGVVLSEDGTRTTDVPYFATE